MFVLVFTSQTDETKRFLRHQEKLSPPMSLAGVVCFFFNSIMMSCTIIGITEIGLKRGLSTVEVLREMLLKFLSGALFKDREFFQLLVLMFE